jgi:hypothetical protein
MHCPDYKSHLQVVDKLFLRKLLPHFQNDDIRLVYSPPGYENITRSQDVFNQVCSLLTNVIRTFVGTTLVGVYLCVFSFFFLFFAFC